MSWLSRGAGRLVPARRRDWVEALWAETGHVRPGMARLAWRAGGMRLMAREALPHLARALVYAAAAIWVARLAWPGPASNPATAINRLNVVTLLPVMAVLPLLARWRFGPPAPGLLARVLRASIYVSVLVLTVVKASVEQVRDNLAVVPSLNPDASVPGKDGMIATWLSESLFLLAVAVYVAAILVLTARRPRIAPVTLAIGTGAGLVLGTVMYVVAPLGLTSHPTNPWLPGVAIGFVVLLAWVLLFGGPIVASIVAGRCYRGPGSPMQAGKARFRQGAAAGFLATSVGALMVSVLGTGTVALMNRAGWMMRWLYPGQHLLAAVAANRALTASVRTDFYGLILLAFPVIGLLMGMLPFASSGFDTGPPPGGGPPGPPGPPEPDPVPDPRIGGQLAGCGSS